MAVAFGGFALVARNTALERLFPGGVAGYAESANHTYMSDGTICVVSFMVLDDAKAWAERLLGVGLSWTSDLAMVHQSGRCLSQSDWLQVRLGRINDTDHQSVEVPLAWLGEDTPVTFSPPPGWRPITLDMVDVQDLEHNYDMVKVDQVSESGVVITYRHRASGRTIYVGRPAVGANDLQARCLVLKNELERLLAMPVSRTRDAALGPLLNDAESVAKASDYRAWQPLFVRGVTARLLGKWALAEGSFRAVTGLNPSFLDGWLELTWALAKLDRIEEAEVSARRAVDIDTRSAPAHSNLASVLLQLGRPEDALPVITRAAGLDPGDTMIQMMLARVREALSRVDPPGDSRRPWYQRWSRR